MIKDKNIDWKWRYLLIPAAAIVNQQAETAGVPTGLGTGGMVMSAINSKLAWGGLEIDAEGNDATGDEIQFWTAVPRDMDCLHPLRIRVYWSTSSSTTTEIMEFIALYVKHTPNSTALIDGTTALDTVIPIDYTVAAYTLQVTDWGIVNGNAFDNGDFIAWEIRVGAQTTITLSSDHIIAVEFAYTPKMTAGPGRAFPAVNPGY